MIASVDHFFAVNPVLGGHSKKTKKLASMTDFRLMQVKSIAECSSNTFDLLKASICR